MNAVAGDCCAFVAERSNAHLKFFAVTAEPSENRRPRLIVKVYVLPLFETIGRPAAASACNLEPSGGALSG